MVHEMITEGVSMLAQVALCMAARVGIRAATLINGPIVAALGPASAGFLHAFAGIDLTS